MRQIIYLLFRKRISFLTFFKLTCNFSLQTIKDGNDPIYPGSNVSKSQSLLLILCFLLRHKLTDVALEDLLLLFNTFFPNTVPATKYKFYKSFQLEDAEICFQAWSLGFPINFFIVTVGGLIINFLSHREKSFSIGYAWDQLQGRKYSTMIRPNF